MTAVVLTMALACPAAAAASLPDTGELGDAVEGGDTVQEADDTVDTGATTVGDTVDVEGEAVEDTVEGSAETVEGSADMVGEAVEDTVGSATTTSRQDPSLDGTTTGSTDGTGGTAGAAGGSETAGVGRDGRGGTGAAAESDRGSDSAAGYATQQPDGRGTSLVLHDSLGWRPASIGLDGLAGTPDRLASIATSSRRSREDGPSTLIATVRISDGREPFVAHVAFGRTGDTTNVWLHPTSGRPLAGSDRGTATGQFRGRVSITGEEPFEADVQLVVRDDGLVLLVTPLKPTSITEVLARVAERLASTGLLVLPLAGLGLALVAAGALAVTGSRRRPWARPVVTSRS